MLSKFFPQKTVILDFWIVRWVAFLDLLYEGIMYLEVEILAFYDP